jgi:3-hydroxybutyryl-CoA dehydrogenase
MVLDKIVVIGAGTMGQGIARIVAETGTEVILCDVNDAVLERSMTALKESLDREIEKWGITASEKKAILARIKSTNDCQAAVVSAKMVFETIPENRDAKLELFRRLDSMCPPETILVSNTSTLSISDLAEATNRPDRVIGMHFLNPVQKIPLVELVRGVKTSSTTYDLVHGFALKLNKTPVLVSEYPGYVTTRTIVPFLNEAMHVLMEGICSAEDIDTAMKLGFGFRMGPLALADLMGLDEVMGWMENMHHELGGDKYNPCPLLRKMVRAGNLGVKTGKGFFNYDNEGNRI